MIIPLGFNIAGGDAKELMSSSKISLSESEDPCTPRFLMRFSLYAPGFPPFNYIENPQLFHNSGSCHKFA